MSLRTCTMHGVLGSYLLMCLLLNAHAVYSASFSSCVVKKTLFTKYGYSQFVFAYMNKAANTTKRGIGLDPEDLSLSEDFFSESLTQLWRQTDLHYLVKNCPKALSVVLPIEK
jgi:hypothetical protein